MKRLMLIASTSANAIVVTGLISPVGRRSRPISTWQTNTKTAAIRNRHIGRTRPSGDRSTATAMAADPTSERLQILDQIALLLRAQVQAKALVVVLDDRGQIGGATVVKVRRVLPQATQRGRAIPFGRAPRRVLRLRADFIRVVQQWHTPRRPLQYIGERRSLVTRCAACLVAKQPAAAVRGNPIEAAARWLGCAQRQLIGKQLVEFRRDEIRRLLDDQANARIGEVALSAHLPDADVGVPVGDWAVAGEGLESHTS